MEATIWWAAAGGLAIRSSLVFDAFVGSDRFLAWSAVPHPTCYACFATMRVLHGWWATIWWAATAVDATVSYESDKPRRRQPSAATAGPAAYKGRTEGGTTQTSGSIVAPHSSQIKCQGSPSGECSPSPLARFITAPQCGQAVGPVAPGTSSVCPGSGRGPGRYRAEGRSDSARTVSPGLRPAAGLWRFAR
jgi:hypothetical protein